jgi:hypothetical protein
MSVGTHYRTSASTGEITIQATPADLRAFSAFASAVPKAAANAQRRAVNKTLGWLRTHIARAVGQKEGIAMKAVRQRLRTYLVRGSAISGKLWFGLNPLEASRTGRARQTRVGVSVGRRRYQGAFFKKVYGGSPDIWIRTASKHFSADDYPASDVSGAAGPSSGWIAEHGDRFPLAKAMIQLDDVLPLFRAWTQQAEARFVELLKQELNYELHKYRSKGRG